MRLAIGLALVALAAMALMAPPAQAQAQVELTEVDPPEGAELDAAPDVVRICFSQPVDIHDIDKFHFGFTMPDQRLLGLRTEFEIDGSCANIHPGLPPDRPAGVYTLNWQVTAAEGDAQGFGTLTFNVTKSVNVTPTATAPATPQPDDGNAGDDDGPDILLIALITLAIAAGAAALGTLGYFLRKRIGYEPHRPPPGGDQGGEH